VLTIILIESDSNKTSSQGSQPDLGAQVLHTDEEDLKNTIKQANTDNLLLVKSESISFLDLPKLVQEALNINKDEILYVAVDAGSNTCRLPQGTPANLLRDFRNEAPWPIACTVLNKKLLTGENCQNINSTIDHIAFSVSAAIARGWSIKSFQGTSLKAADDSKNDFVSRPGKSCLSQCLIELIDSSNIEDLFPEHAWSLHGKESAAASYHSLAAVFIRLEDAERALQCLALSDSLEDSPRSLALKGLIAQQKGETLAAVANLVSSLQEYEKRKIDKGEAHYLTFQPKDFDIINTRLAAGLEALNVKDNSTALNHFIEAVWNFDSFYESYGLTNID